jgi:hypothetical protein
VSPLHGAVHAPTQGPHRIRLLTRALAGLVLLALLASGCTLFEGIGAQGTEIDLSLPNGQTLMVTIVDESRTLADARFAQDTDFVGVEVPGDEAQRTLAPTHDPRIVRLLWLGSACDRSAEVAVS